MLSKTTYIDRVALTILRWYIRISAILGIIFLLINIIQGQAIGLTAIVAGLLIYAFCFYLTFFVKDYGRRFIIGVAFLQVIQLIYIHALNTFTFLVVIGIGWIRIFETQTFRSKADYFTISTVVVESSENTISGWGINFIATFLLLYCLYIYSRYISGK